MSNNSTIAFAERLSAALKAKKEADKQQTPQPIAAFANVLAEKLAVARTLPQTEETKSVIEEGASILSLIADVIKAEKNVSSVKKTSSLLDLLPPKEEAPQEDKDEEQADTYSINDLISAYSKPQPPPIVEPENDPRPSIPDEQEEVEEPNEDEEINIYVDGLGPPEEDVEEDHADREELRRLETLLTKKLEAFGKQIQELEVRSKVYAESYGGGGGSNAVQYRDGGTMYGDLTVLGDLSANIALGNTVSVSATNLYNVQPQDYLILVDASSATTTIRLPDIQSLSINKEYHVKKIDNTVNYVHISGSNGQTVDGTPHRTITNQWTSINVRTDGQNWYII